MRVTDMPKPKVFVTRIIPEAGLDMVTAETDAEVWQEQLPPPREVIIEKLADKDGLLCLLTDKIDGEVMDAGPGLKVISNYAVGFDNISVPDATARGIPVGNTPGVLTETTAEMAFALLMSVSRRIVEADKYTRARQWMTWEPKLLLGRDLHGSTLGIVGLGRIGQRMAQQAAGFECKIIYHDVVRNDEAAAKLGAEYRELDDLLRESDFVTLHTELTDETRHLISTREFELMGPDCILINTSRGPVVDEAALYEALRDETILAAGLDVTEVEPIPDDSPLLELENIVIAPHIASASLRTRSKMATMAAGNLLAGVKGEKLPNCVNPEAQE
jgi:glyoxylate reductase